MDLPRNLSTKENRNYWNNIDKAGAYAQSVFSKFDTNTKQNTKQNNMNSENIIINNIQTFNAKIFVGFKHRNSGECLPNGLSMVKQICQEYVDKIGLCVSINLVDYIYTNSNEPGACITLINYPRFPSTPTQITEHALKLAKLLGQALLQIRVSVVTNDQTYMLTFNNRPPE